MTQHIHVYSTKGRCTGSFRLGDRTIHPSVEATLVNRLKFSLFEGGYYLDLWLESEQAGIVSAQGQEFIVRLKSDGTCRDMRPAGVAQLIQQIGRDGVKVSSILNESID